LLRKVSFYPPLYLLLSSDVQVTAPISVNTAGSGRTSLRKLTSVKYSPSWITKTWMRGLPLILLPIAVTWLKAQHFREAQSRPAITQLVRKDPGPPQERDIAVLFSRVCRGSPSTRRESVPGSLCRLIRTPMHVLPRSYPE